jgi:PAS domain S-box-containing protein
LTFSSIAQYPLTEKQKGRLKKWLNLTLWVMLIFSLGLTSIQLSLPLFDRNPVNLFLVVATGLLLALLRLDYWRVVSWSLCLLWAGVLMYSILFTYQGLNWGLVIGLVGVSPLAIVFLGNQIGLFFGVATQIFVVGLFIAQESHLFMPNTPLTLADVLLLLGGISILAGLQLNAQRDFIKSETELTQNYQLLEEEINTQTNELLNINRNLMQEMLIREETEFELLIQQQRYQKLFVDAPQAILVIDLRKNQVIQANRQAITLFQTELFKLISLPHFSLYPERQPNGFSSQELLETLINQLKADSESLSTEFYIQDTDGQYIPCELHLRYLALGEERLIISHIIDLRTRHNLEKQLQQKQTLETLGELAGGVVHDLNNILTVIIGYSELLLRQTNVEHSRYPMLTQIKQASYQAAEMTQQVLHYTRQAQTIEEMYFDLNVVTQRTIDLLRLSFPASIILEYHNQTRHQPWFWGQEIKIQQVLLNLLINARQAIEELDPESQKGNIQVFLTQEMLLSSDSAPLNILTGAPLPPENYLVLEVHDTGKGIDEQTQSSIFNAFFTTKPTGSGLGLATVKNIVQNYHGGISLKSQLGQGTSFAVWLPDTENMPPKP